VHNPFFFVFFLFLHCTCVCVLLPPVRSKDCISRVFSSPNRAWLLDAGRPVCVKCHLPQSDTNRFWSTSIGSRCAS